MNWRNLIFFLLLLCRLDTIAQVSRILHYTETSGYDHLTRQVSYNMFLQMGIENNFIVDNDSTGDSFNSLTVLQQYDIIVFANTTGDGILNSAQQQNFMQYVSDGGHVIGIHSATDTYRHSSANGGNVGAWDWFPELIGASVQVNPSHVNGTPVYNISAQTIHPLINNLPDPWNKAEEYYYWEGGYFNTLNNILQNVEETIGPNGQVNSYDSARAVSWYRELSQGQKIFYTALGHDVINYTGDTVFYQLLENAVLWMGDNGTSIKEPDIVEEYFNIFPNPFVNEIMLTCNHHEEEVQLSVLDLTGRIKITLIANCNQKIYFPDLDLGCYFLIVSGTKGERRMKIFKV